MSSRSYERISSDADSSSEDNNNGDAATTTEATATYGVGSSLLQTADARMERDIQIDLLPKNRIRTANVFSSCINLCNTIIGAGVLSLPYALAANGAVFGVMIMVVCACASSFGLWLLVQCTDFHGKDILATYYSCAKLAYPNWPWLAFVIDSIVFIKCFGVAVSYLIVIGDVMPDVMTYFLHMDDPTGSSSFSDLDSIAYSRQFWIGCFAVLIVPIVFFKRLHQLRFTSFLGLLTVVYLFCLVFIYYFLSPENAPNPPKVETFIFSTRFFQVMTIFVFGFTCHQNIFTIYNELIDPRPARINTVIFSSIGTSLLVYVFIGVFGYLTYGEAVEDNIMNSYPTDPTVTVGRLVVAVHVAFSYPMQSHPSRICMDNMYRVLYKATTKNTPAEQTTLRYVVETCIFIACTWGLGLIFEELDVILGLVGALGSTSMVYILPPAFFLKLDGIKPLSPVKVFAIIQFIAGCFIIPTAVAFIFIGDDDDSGDDVDASLSASVNMTQW